MRTAGKDWSGDAATGRALKVRRALHILRHTFCSHLALRGVPPLSLKELAGHRTLRTTMRYMHLGKGEKHRAIQMLEEGGATHRLGDILETRRSLASRI